MYNLEQNLYLRERKNSPGGNIVFLCEHQNVQSVGYDNNYGYITGITMVGTNKFYRYDLPKSNINFSNKVEISVPNACYKMIPELKFNAPGLQSSRLKLYDFLVRKSVIAIVRSIMGQYFVIGAQNGIDITSDTSFMSGTAGVDLIGTTYVLQGSETIRITQIEPSLVDSILSGIVYTNVGITLSVGSKTNSTITLEWDFNDDEAGIVSLEKSTSPWTTIYTGLNTSFTDTGLTTGIDYHYRIKYDNGSTIIYSNELTEQIDLVDTLVAYITFDGDSTDSTGNYTPVDTTGVTYGTGGTFGHYANMVSGYTTICNDGIGNFDYQSFSISAWVEISGSPSALVAGGIIPLFLYSGNTNISGNTDTEFFVANSSNESGITNNFINVTYGMTSWLDSNIKPQNTGWTFWTLVVSGSSFKIYINSIEKADVSMYGRIPTYDHLQVYIGKFSVEWSLNNSNGKIAEWGYWNNCLSQSNIDYLYNSGSGRTYPFTI